MASSEPKLGLNADSSPFQSSPLDSTTSPRLFWQNRNGFNTENLYGGGIGGSPSPTRRSSIERLQKASRVKNSSILAQEQKNEYDPTKIPRVERPLSKVQSNSFGSLSFSASLEGNEVKGHQRRESKTDIPLYNPAKTSPSVVDIDSPPHIPGQLSASIQSDKSDTPAAPAADSTPVMASKEPGSPIKSSLSSRFKSSYDEHGDFSLDASVGEYELPLGRTLHRHAKSVTFDAAPPQVNEYEMATPDLSSVGSNSREGSYDSQDDEDDYDDYRYSANDHGNPDDSFDASLEDTDKTPVVGPDDWRQDSPDARRGHNMYDSSPMPDAVPSSVVGHQDVKSSLGSSGDHRPLPPLPGMGHAHTNSATSPSLSATAERMLGGSPRGLPSPPPAAVSKSEMQNIGNSKMTLEERLKLMMLSDDGKSAAELQRERRMRRAGPKDRANSQTPEPESSQRDAASEHGEEEDTIGDLSGLEEYRLPPRISRESILRRVNGAVSHERESDYNFSSPAPSSSPERRLPLDPDVPIPSTERDDDDNISVDDEACEKHNEAYDIPDMYDDDDDEDDDAEDYESNYSEEQAGDVAQPTHADGVSTPRPATPVQEISSHTVTVDDIHRSDLAAIAQEGRISLGETRLPLMPKSNDGNANANHMQPPNAEVELARPQTPERKVIQHKHLSKPEYDGSGWGDDEEFDDEPGTPDSVIHHPVQDDEDDIFEDEQDEEDAEMEAYEPPAVPDQMATIKASGSKLKTRPSATPSDLVAMREARRQVSREVPDVPPIPDRHRNRLSRDMGREDLEGTGDDFLERHPSFKKRSLTLDLDLGLSLDKDFERVIENQKRGYLMRQNTKLVAASDKEHGEDFRGARSAGNSPVKKERPQSWTVEPWNGERRKSIRKRGVPSSGPVPPMPGQESNATALNPLTEEEYVAETTTDEGAERGRLFVKVMGVKDLDLPISRTERTWFSLTLDNGVHCVTTAWLELARNAPIGQEFELLVPNDLEFQLTLNVKLEKPVQRKVVQASPAKVVRPKASTFSRVFASPKKRKEMELRMKEEDERAAREQQEAQAKLRNAAPTAYDLLSPIVAEDGSFARAYVCLKEHESRCYGRPGIVEIACFNEWATEEAGFASSVKSKRGNMAVVRRAPYKIGKLELQLLFVPRPKGISNDDMPKSMNSCIREMKAAEERQSQNWEGHLSQQGGDCPYWRRRYFKLVGTKLTAYHEATRQPRATINLANAKRLIDDRRALTEKETTGKNGRRRRSAFAEEEEGYMFVEEGFRIRFNNGEVIDFYADTAADKEGWMKVLSEVTARDSYGSEDDLTASRAKTKWCELVLKREEALRRRVEGRSEGGRRVHSRTKSSYV
ncbi:Bud site selection protein bud4 [Sporothrix stenoceras]|uniref:Bud site selection protein bud4 n=1 Tax=Sporothrix stenoceras TaxID=5173 RepID=A0ABR3ZGZ9_9PEZI